MVTRPSKSPKYYRSRAVIIVAYSNSPLVEYGVKKLTTERDTQ